MITLIITHYKVNLICLVWWIRHFVNFIKRHFVSKFNKCLLIYAFLLIGQTLVFNTANISLSLSLYVCMHVCMYVCVCVCVCVCMIGSWSPRGLRNRKNSSVILLHSFARQIRIRTAELISLHLQAVTSRASARSRVRVDSCAVGRKLTLLPAQ
jgi:hypothetical protein